MGPPPPLIRTRAHSKKTRSRSPRDIIPGVRQPMRNVRALRVSKAVLVFAIAVFYTILVLNNITDYGSNYEYVRHVLMMDSTFPGNHLHVARPQFAAGTYGLLHRHHRLGSSHYASMLVGWCSVAEIVSCGQGAIRRRAEPRRDCADDEPADVVGGIPRCRGRMVSNVAVENVEWAGRGVPNVYHCRCGVFGCGATRANSRLVGVFWGLLPAWTQALINDTNSNPHLPLRTGLSRADTFLFALFFVGLIRSAIIGSRRLEAAINHASNPNSSPLAGLISPNT
jgi:Predicted small integral membrane protein (DUF2165)